MKYPQIFLLFVAVVTIIIETTISSMSTVDF